MPPCCVQSLYISTFFLTLGYALEAFIRLRRRLQTYLSLEGHRVSSFVGDILICSPPLQQICAVVMTGTRTSSMDVADLFTRTIQNLLNACPVSSELPSHFVLLPTFQVVKCVVRRWRQEWHVKIIIMISLIDYSQCHCIRSRSRCSKHQKYIDMFVLYLLSCWTGYTRFGMLVHHLKIDLW